MQYGDQDILEKRVKNLELENQQYKLLLESLISWDHDFRVSLSPILIFSTKLLDTSLDSRQKEYAEKIQHYSHVLLNDFNKFRKDMIDSDDETESV